MLKEIRFLVAALVNCMCGGETPPPLNGVVRDRELKESVP